ncbi:NAD(P)-binding protein [Atractiella rhizophila]|nr:NAD(P)-binding protein [Atractiella rhizophila]
MGVFRYDPTQDLNLTERTTSYAAIDVRRNEKIREGIKGKVVLITGASKGIGKAIAEGFALAGAASLYICARGESGLLKAREDILELLKSEGRGMPRIDWKVLDVTSTEGVKATIEDCVKINGRLDIVVNCAAVMPLSTPFLETDPATWHSTMTTNLFGNYLISRFSLPHLITSKGYLVLMSTAGAQQILTGINDYQVSKHASNRLVEMIDFEHGKDGVKCFAVHPGGVKTDMTLGFPDLEAFMTDDPSLPGHGIVRLCSGTEDWLSGRYVACPWDIDELNREDLKRKIIETDALKNKLLVPEGFRKSG